MQMVTRKHSGGRPPKLTDVQRDLIVNQYNHGETQKALAEKFGVSITTIRKLLRERRNSNATE